MDKKNGRQTYLASTESQHQIITLRVLKHKLLKVFMKPQDKEVYFQKHTIWTSVPLSVFEKQTG